MNDPAVSTRSADGGSPPDFYLYGGDGSRMGMLNASGTDHYFVSDHLGSVLAAFDASGNVLEENLYEPYGEPRASSSSTVDNPWRFAQGYLDSESGLQKHGVRYYDRQLGSFTQIDPKFGELANPVTLNAYQYAVCDPANNIDATGRQTEAACALSLFFAGVSLIDIWKGLAFATGSAATGFVPGVFGGVAVAVLGVGGFFAAAQFIDEYCFR